MKPASKYSIIRRKVKEVDSALWNGFRQTWGEQPKEKRQDYICTYLNRIQDVLKNGLDIGTIRENRVPVSLVQHEKHGICFYDESRNMLYRINNHIRY